MKSLKKGLAMVLSAALAIGSLYIPAQAAPSVRLSETSLNMTVGEEKALTIITSDDGGKVTDDEGKVTDDQGKVTDDEGKVTDGQGTEVSPKNGRSVVTSGSATWNIEWTTSDAKVATVTDNGFSGVVKAVGAGSATITAKVNGTALTCAVTVTGGGTVSPIDAQSVTVTPKDFSVKKGETRELTAKVEPAGADQTVTWSIDKKEIATVDPTTGVVTGVAKGTATITATTANGKFDTATVTVTEEAVAAESVTISPNPLDIKVGGTGNLTATVAPAGADQTVTWSIDNTAVAAVDPATGVVTGVAEGSATITATAANGVTGTCAVNVSNEPTPPTVIAVKGIKLPAKAVVAKGKAKTLKVTYNPANTTQKGVTWKSSAPKIAKVDKNGKVTGLKAGTATITATSTVNKAVKATCVVTVSTVTLNAKSTVLQVKKSSTALKATVSTKQDSVQGWKSSNTKILTVDKKGKITGKKAGTAKVTVTTKAGATAICTVKVQKAKVVTKSLSMAKKLTAAKGTSVTLTVTRNPITATEKITWKTSNKKVATVKNGKVTFKKAGKVTITATANKKSAKCAITVKNPSVKLKSTKATIKVKKTAQIVIKSTFPAGDKVKAYKSSNTKVATVSKKGVVTGKKAGTATITVTMKSGAKAMFKVTVKK